MSSRRSTLLVLLDAFRWDYLTETQTPYLWRLAQEGTWVRKLRPSPGFCERTDLFTGAHPDVTGNFTAITYDPLSSSYANNRIGLGFFNLLESLFAHGTLTQKLVRKTARVYFSRLKGISQPIYDIPFHELDKFGLTEDRKSFWQPGAFRVESVFDVMRRENMTVFWQSFTALGMDNGTDKDRCRMLKDNFDKRHDLYLLYVGMSDIIPHKYGTQSPQRVATTQRIDGSVGELVQTFQSRFRDPNILIIGDHGMVDVQRSIDLRRKLNRHVKTNRVRLRQDLIAFFDSTMARFWCKTDGARAAVEELLDDPEVSRHGSIVTESEAQRLHVPGPGQGYGDVIWWAKAGVIICPDYFHRHERYRAMHGYGSDLDAEMGLAIVSGPRATTHLIPRARLLDTCPTLCDLLGIRAPWANVGRTLLGPG